VLSEYKDLGSSTQSSVVLSRPSWWAFPRSCWDVDMYTVCSSMSHDLDLTYQCSMREQNQKETLGIHVCDAMVKGKERKGWR